MNELEKYANYQNELIGILANVPEYFKRTVLKKEYFDKKHGLLFEIMEKSYRENGTVLHELIFSNSNVDSMLYVECTANTIHTYVEYFEGLERYAVEKYKKEIIFDMATKLRNDVVNFDEFDNNYKNIQSLGVIKGNRLTEKNIIDVLLRKSKSIKHSNFNDLWTYLRSDEKDFIVLAGKTGAGKTAFALNLLCDLSKHYPCLYFNMEMSEERLIQRVIALTSNVKFSNIKNFENQHQDIINAVKKNARTLGERNIEIISKSQNLDSIRRYIAAYDNHNEHFIVFVDHMGLVRARGKTSYEIATAVAKGLRAISLDNNCTIISLCQLSREAKKAQKPSLDLLRDSGEIEQSARKVIFVWENNDHYALHIEKNDSGALATIPVYFDKDKQLFKEIDQIRR